MWSYKDHGKSYDAVYNREHSPGFRWLHESFGTNWRMTKMQAVIGRIQLQRMPQWQAQRLANCEAIWRTACELGSTSLMFLCHPTLTDEEIRKTYSVVRDVLAEAALEL